MITVRVPLPLTVTEIHEEDGVPYLEVTAVEMIHLKVNVDQALLQMQTQDRQRLEAEGWFVMEAEDA